MRLLLAPMEGVLDPLLRQLLTEINQYTLAVTEFLRVVDCRLPTKCFLRRSPELNMGGCTPAGTPVRLQLLGQAAPWLAENAAHAIALGSPGIDLNCGCPSKVVNGHGGGATLLKTPEHIFRIVQAVRAAIPSTTCLSVKMRLGWEDIHHRLEIADAIQQGGADELVVHGRTKADGYRAEAINWSAIGDIRRYLTIPVIANGEIWGLADACRCIDVTGCKALMVGRGALAIPNLGQVIKRAAAPLAWAGVLDLLLRYSRMQKENDRGRYHLARIKQWLGFLRLAYPQATPLFCQVRALNVLAEMVAVIQHWRVEALNHNDSVA